MFHFKSLFMQENKHPSIVHIFCFLNATHSLTSMYLVQNAILPCLPQTKISAPLCSRWNGKASGEASTITLLTEGCWLVVSLGDHWGGPGGAHRLRICPLGHKRHTICACGAVWMYLERLIVAAPLQPLCVKWILDDTLAAGYRPDGTSPSPAGGTICIRAMVMICWSHLGLRAAPSWQAGRQRDTKLQENKPADHLILACQANNKLFSSQFEKRFLIYHDPPRMRSQCYLCFVWLLIFDVDWRRLQVHRLTARKSNRASHINPPLLGLS